MKRPWQRWVVLALALVLVTSGVSAGNRQPIAQDDQIMVTGTAFVVVDVLANDSDADGDPLTVTFSAGVQGLTDLGGGLLKFQPTACLSEDLAVNYQVEDGQQGSASAVVTFAAGGCGDNRPPTAHPDPCFTSVSVLCSVRVLENDGDPDGDSLTVDRVAEAVHGTAWVTPDGERVEFMPDPGYSGTDAGVRYWASDGLGGEDDAWVHISVSNAPPGQGLLDNTVTTERDKILSISALELVADDIPSGHTFISASSRFGDRVEVISPPGGSPEVLLFPPTGFVGELRFEYVAESPGSNPVLGTADIILRVTHPVGSMQAADDRDLRTVPNGCLTIDPRVLIANDLYSGQELPTLNVLTSPLVGSIAPVGGGSSLYDYQPLPSYVGFDALEYQVSDSLPGASNFDVATVLIEVQSATAAGARVPVAQPDWALSSNNQIAYIPVLANDYDPDCTTLQIDGFPGTTSLGAISLNAGNQLRYVPHQGAVGTDVFQYRIRDAAGNYAYGTVTVEVDGAIYPPCPRFDYRDCADMSTCVLNATASRASTSALNSCGGAPWSFANQDYWLQLESVNQAAAQPHSGGASWIRAQRDASGEKWFPMETHYAQPGLMRGDLTLYEHDPSDGTVLTASSGRWVPVGGTTDEWTIGHRCVNSSCIFWPEGHWLDGVVDRFEWFYDGIRYTTGCNGLQCGLSVPDPDAVTAGMDEVAHAYTSLSAGSSFEVTLLVHLFDRPNGVTVRLNGTIPIPPPAAASGLQASNSVCAASGPLLTWVDQSHTEDGFRIYRAVNGGPWGPLMEVAEDETQVQDFYDGPDNDQLTYRLVAFNDGGESAFVEVIGRPTPADCGVAGGAPLAPSDLAADPPSGGLRLYWRDNSAQEAGFRIYRQANAGAGAFQLAGTVGTDTETFYDVQIAPNGSYTYRVAAFNAQGETVAAADLTVAVPDFLFADSFESGNTGAWTTAVGLVTGSSMVSGAGESRALAGERDPSGADGLEVVPAGLMNTLLRPSALRVAGFRRGGVDLLWRDNSSTELGFKVLRKEKGSPYAELAVLPANASASWDGPLEPGKVVRYRVEAFTADRKKKSGVLRVKVPKDVFSDSFETGDLRHWSGEVDPADRLAGSFSAALFGNRGLEVALESGAPGYAIDDTPSEELRTRARVLVDARRVLPPAGLAEGQPFVTFLRGASEDGVERFSLRLVKLGGGLALEAVVSAADGSTLSAPPVPLDGRVYFVEVDWDARDLTGLGRFRLWLDGKRKALLEGWPTGNALPTGQSIGQLLLGAVELAPGADGFLSLDELSVRRGGGKVRRRGLAGQVLAEGFEFSDTVEWGSFTNSGGLYLVPASLEGEQALQVSASGSGAYAYLERTLRHRERHLLASLLVDAAGLALPQEESLTILSALDPDSGQIQVELRLKQTADGLKAVARSRDGTGWGSKRLLLPAGPARIEIEWRSSTNPGAADGTLVLRVTDETTEDTERKLLEGLATGGNRLQTVRVGITEATGAGVSGSLLLDDLEGWR